MVQCWGQKVGRCRGLFTFFNNPFFFQFFDIMYITCWPERCADLRVHLTCLLICLSTTYLPTYIHTYIRIDILIYAYPHKLNWGLWKVRIAKNNTEIRVIKIDPIKLDRNQFQGSIHISVDDKQRKRLVSQ